MRKRPKRVAADTAYSSDRNLLFGILAIQMDFISSEEFQKLLETTPAVFEAK